MTATQISESSPKIQQSAKLYQREETCEMCGFKGEGVGYMPCKDGPKRVCPECGKELIHKKREQLADEIIPALFREARLEHLSTALQEKINNLPDNRGLLFWGKQGVGKSYAMAAIMRKFILAGKKAARITYEMLCLQIRDTYKQGSKKTELDVIKPLIEVDVLFIEDVGTTVSAGQQESDFSLRTFYVLLDQRLENCKPTFITTNKSVEELGKSFDQRIASRLQQACDVIHLAGKDRRVV